MNLSPEAAARGRRDVLVLVAVLGGVFSLGALATDLFQPALPAVAEDLHVGTRSAQLTVTAVLIGLSLGQLVAGPLSDRLGRRRPLMVGLAVFVTASLLCAVAPSVAILTAMRLVQGVAAAGGIALGNAIVTDHYRGREAARVLSRLIFVSLAIPVLAPLLGSLVLSFASWRGLFLTMAIVGAVLLTGVGFGLRESLPPERRTSGRPRQLYAGIVNLRHDRGFLGLTLSAGLMYSAFFAYLTGASFVIQARYGASPLLFSVLFSINAAGMMLASHVNHMLLARFAPRVLCAVGMAGCLVAGLTALLVTLIPALGLAALAVPLFVLVFSVGLATPNVTALALSRHPEAAGSAAAGFGTLRLGIASATTPLVGIGGAVAAVPMAAVMAGAGAAALAVFAAVWRRAGGAEPAPDAALTPGEAADDVAVG